MLDGDYIGGVHPFEIYDESRLNHLDQTFLNLIKFHIKNGYDNFVINYVFEDAKSLKLLVDLLQPLCNYIKVFWLTCSEKEQKNGY